MQEVINGKRTVEEETNSIRGTIFWIIQLIRRFSQEMTIERDEATNLRTGKYNRWKSLLGVMVLIVAVLYPFKMFYE